MRCDRFQELDDLIAANEASSRRRRMRPKPRPKWGWGKITEDQVAEIRRLRAAGTSTVRLAEMFDTSPAQVSRIANLKSRVGVGS